MDPLYVQNLRYKLQRRVYRLNSISTEQSFISGLRQFWRFVENQPTIQGIIEQLVSSSPNSLDEAEKIEQSNPVYADTDEHAAALGYSVLKKISSEEKKVFYIAQAYRQSASHFSERLDTIREEFLEPFYNFIDEQLDDQRAMLALLLRYKHRSEWFNRKRLYELAQAESRITEKNLAFDLYAFLYDQGIDFNIETGSIRGSIDLIAAQHSEDPLLLDAKVFDAESRGKSYIRKGFRQIYTYTQQFNEPFGYLIIYNISERDLHFSLEELLNTPLVVHNHKTIFLITIDIYPHEKPVSQRPPLEVVEITEDELIESTQNDDVPTDN